MIGRASSPPQAGAGRTSLEARVRKLEGDNLRLKSGLGNLCVWFKHPPQVDDPGLHAWLYKVGLGCPSFGLH